MELWRNTNKAWLGMAAASLIGLAAGAAWADSKKGGPWNEPVPTEPKILGEEAAASAEIVPSVAPADDLPEARRCPADVDDGKGHGVRDGAVTIDDLLYYMDLFTQGHMGADQDDGTGTGIPDYGVNLDDLLYFLGRFEKGC